MIYDNLQAISSWAPLTSGLRYQGGFRPYQQLAEEVGRVATAFGQRGIAVGDPVAILLPNSPDLFVVAHALFAIGAIAMPLGLTAPLGEYLDIVRKAGVTAVVARPELARIAGQICEALGEPKSLHLFLSGEDGEFSLGALARTAAGSLPPVGPEAPALYLLSSGSTGLPKVVPHTHAELLADARRTSQAWRITPDDLVFDMLPGNFAMGFLLGALDAPEAGASTLYWNDPHPLALARQKLLATLAAERVTLIGAVPAMYDTLAGANGEFDLRAIRLAFSGGAALKRQTFENFRDRFGIPIRQNYGSTEAIMVSHNDAEDIDRLWDSVGRPAGDARVRLAPTEGELGPDVGELMVQSSSMTKGYFGDQKANETTFRDGWHLSGDLARIDDEGNIFIKGRSKLLIEISGFKIDPIEVEEALLRHPAVAEAVVAGSRSNRGEIRLKAFVVRADSLTEENLIRFLRERLSPQKIPSLVEFRDELPKSSAGKLLRGQLDT